MQQLSFHHHRPIGSNSQEVLPNREETDEKPKAIEPATAVPDPVQPNALELPPSEHGRWDDFVATTADGTIFHTTWWYRAWGVAPTVLASVNGQGDLQGGLCFGLGRRLGVRAIVRPPMTARNGPVFLLPADSGPYQRNTRAKKMMLLAIQGLPRLGMYDFVLSPGQSDVMPFLWNGFDVDLGYTYVLPCLERDTWQSNAAKTHQRHIRKAVKEAAENGLQIEADAPLDAVLPLLDSTADAKQFAFDRCRAKVPTWWDAVRRHDAGRAYLLRDEQGQPAAATLMVWDSRSAYYLAGGLRSDLRKRSIVNILLFLRMIEDAHRQGLDFDFEGSILPGVERFFRSFGGELRPACRLVKLPSLPAYLLWVGHRYWTRHRPKDWIWHE